MAGGGVHGCGACMPQGHVCLGACVHRGVFVPGGMHGWGACMAGGVHGGRCVVKGACMVKGGHAW